MERQQHILKLVRNQSYFRRVLEFLTGVFIVACAYNIFVAPNHLVPKGVGGVAVILNSVFGLNNSAVVFISNGILLVASLIFLGKDKTKATIFGSLIYPIFIRLTEDLNVWLQIDTSNLLLSALFGGIIYGVGTGLIFRAGFTTGGTDILNQILNKYAKISIGKGILIIDGLIVLSSGIFLGVNIMLYSIVCLYITSMISDRVILGISDSKTFMIVTEKEEAVTNYIVKHLHHGVTPLTAKGGYNIEKETVIMTVLPTKDYYRLKEGIRRIDKDAFYIITDTYEVFGGD